LQLRWSKADLLRILDARLNRLIQHNYSGGDVTWRDIFPEQVNRQATGDYVVERTLYRPRDIIQFCNCCIALASDKPQISAQNVRDAETEYSTLRFRSLGDEWAADYPELLDVAGILKKRMPLFPVDEIDANQLDGYCIKELESDFPGKLREHFQDYYNGNISLDELRAQVLGIFYDVGLVGLKVDTSKPVSWSFLDRDVLRAAEILPTTRVAICPMFFRVLSVNVIGDAV
jgi:hypothetical protein